MNDIPEGFAEGRVFEEFEYRLLYLRPTPYSDERIAVGLVATRQGSLEARFVSSVPALALMAQILGENAVEQYQFAAAELRRAVSGGASLDGFAVPSDLFVAGEKLAAVTHDREGLLANLLAAASCLVRMGAARSVDPFTPPPPSQLQRDLFERVSRLNPFVGRRIFNNKFTASTGQIVTLPILGDRIFGAPISFAAREQMMKAESYVAKFRWLNGQMPQEPRIYLLAPGDGREERATHADPGIRELRAIAEASGVPLKISASTEGMASQILKDEAA